MKKLTSIYFFTLALITIVLMLVDYSKYPFNPLNDRIGNPQNSIVVYPVLVCVEFLLILLTIKGLKKEIPLIYKLTFCLGWFIATFFAFINTMWGGGVLAVHAIWMLVVSISLLCLLFLGVIMKKNKKN